MDFVYASAYDEARAELALVRRRTEALVALIRQLACTMPREREWERNYRALQIRARRALEMLANDAQSKPA